MIDKPANARRSPDFWVEQLFRVIRFGIVGLSATAAYGLIVWVAVSAFEVAPLPASFIAWAVTIIYSYLAQRVFTFKSTGTYRVEVPRFVVTSLFGLACTTGSMLVITEYLGYHYGFAVVTAMFLVPVMSFLIMQFWVFTPGESDSSGG